MRHILAVFMLITLAACSSSGSKPDAKTASAETMYQEAKKDLDKNNFEAASKQLESLQSVYPYGRYAQQAQLDLAYAYYKQSEPDSAISAADTFIKQYPNNPHVDYAYYVKGLANFNPDIGAFGLAFGQDPTERDPQTEKDSFAAFKDLVTRFPASSYAPDSRLRIQYLVDALAKYNIHVARYYLRRGADVAAVNRAKEVLTEYPNSNWTKDALQVLVEGYGVLGLDKLRDDAQRVLTMNFPRAALTSSEASSR
ncbi:MAG: outer membrane protein assembly factor BamD [Gallionella sp.]